MDRSMSTTSGCAAEAISTASAPSPAAPTTSRSGAAANRFVSPSRTSEWSSATRTVVTAGASAGPSAPQSRGGASGADGGGGEAGGGGGGDGAEPTLGCCGGRHDGAGGHVQRAGGSVWRLLSSRGHWPAG